MTEVDDGLDSLADTAAALAGELSLDAVLQTITSAAARLTGARYAALGVIGDDQTISLLVTAARGQPERSGSTRRRRADDRLRGGTGHTRG